MPFVSCMNQLEARLYNDHVGPTKLFPSVDANKIDHSNPIVTNINQDYSHSRLKMAGGKDPSINQVELILYKRNERQPRYKILKKVIP